MRLPVVITAAATLLGVAISGSSTAARRTSLPSYTLRVVTVDGRHMQVLFKSRIVGGEYSEWGFADLSPDRTQGLMQSIGKSVWVAGLRGQHRRLIAWGPAMTYYGGWSRDGQRVYYETYNGQTCDSLTFWSAAPTGTDTRVLGFGEGFAWGPDHNSFAIEHGCNPSGNYRLVFTDDSGREHVIANDGAHDIAVSPRGDEIAYTTPDWTLHLARTDGSGDIATIPDADSAAWAPDGRRLVFVTTRTAPRPGAIAVANRDGTHRHVIVTSPRGRPNESYAVASWSPDGRRIAYMRANRRVGTVLPDGRGQRILAHGNILSIWWSPDSRRIYYGG